MGDEIGGARDEGGNVAATTSPAGACGALRGAAEVPTEMAARDVTPLGDPVMSASFLVPALNGPILRRRRLLDRLSAAVAGRPLTVVCAPAGSGKTVLASSWVSSGAAPRPVVWISLDEDDDRPGVFWTYVVAGLERGGVDIADVTVP